jgi:polyphenol oxidase
MPERICMKNDRVLTVNRNGVEFVQFENLSKYEELVTHCFTTRIGGVSTGECKTLNLGFNRKDARENVLENYRRLGEALALDFRNMVFSNQVHDSKVRVVDEDDRGKGITRESDICGYDALVTNREKVVLVTFYADCVPVYLLDPVRKAIGLAHSGWRGTVREIAAETVRVMNREYGTIPGDIQAAIGPSIGKCCFEVGSEVYEEFAEKLSWSTKYCVPTSPGKWHIHLQEIIKNSLQQAGVPEKNINNSGICTKCNTNTFFSHRGDEGKTGSLAAVMQINPVKG